MITIEKNIYLAGLIPEAGDANSYFVQHSGPSGNWLINAPQPNPNLIAELEKLGGVKHVFATHRDVVSHIGEIAAYFKAIRIIHLADLDAMPDADIVLEGREPVILAKDEDWLALPTPGHTEGHCMLLYAKQFLFSGDALAVSGDQLNVEAPEWTWQSHELNIESVGQLALYPFTRVLPDHGNSLSFGNSEASKFIVAAVKNALLADIDPEEQKKSLIIYIDQLRGFGQKVQLDKMLAKLAKIK